MKASHGSDHHNISRSNLAPDQTIQKTNLRSHTTSVQALQTVIYYASAVMSAKDLCLILLAHNIVAKNQLKHIQVALLLSSALLSQSESMNPCNLYIITQTSHEDISRHALQFIQLSWLGSTWNYFHSKVNIQLSILQTSHSIFDSRMGLLDQSLSTSSDLSS